MNHILALSLFLVLSACGDKPPAPQPPPITPPGPIDPVDPTLPDPGPEPIACPKTAELRTEGLTQQEADFLDEIPQLTLIGGTPAPAGKFKASVVTRAGNSACTGTIIGPRVLASAAHCMANGSRISFQAEGNSYTAVCAHHSEYRRNSTADWALCYIDRSVTNVPFESLAKSTAELKVGQKLLLGGYGCVRPGGSGGNDGIFRIGYAEITRLPSGTNYDIVTRLPAALCYGDSGGAAYNDALPNDGREIHGTNSRGDIATTSYLPAWGLSTAQAFVKSFAETNGVKICGVHEDAQGCRNTPPAPPLLKFVVSGKAACAEGWLKPGYEPKKSEARAKVFQALDMPL